MERAEKKRTRTLDAIEVGTDAEATNHVEPRLPNNDIPPDLVDVETSESEDDEYDARYEPRTVRPRSEVYGNEMNASDGDNCDENHDGDATDCVTKHKNRKKRKRKKKKRRTQASRATSVQKILGRCKKSTQRCLRRHWRIHEPHHAGNDEKRAELKEAILDFASRGDGLNEDHLKTQRAMLAEAEVVRPSVKREDEPKRDAWWTDFKADGVVLQPAVLAAAFTRIRRPRRPFCCQCRERALTSTFRR